MENIKVTYTQNWDCEGYHTTQNIKISKELLDKFSAFVSVCREPIMKKHIISNAEMDLLAYGKIVSNLERCLTHTQLLLLYRFLYNEGIDCSRIKTDRNTMLIVA